MRRTVISGTGLITPLGVGVEETWRALLAGECIHGHAACQIAHNRGQARITAMALTAVREALLEAEWGDAVMRSGQTALIVGTSKGPVEDWLRPNAQLLAGRSRDFGVGSLATELAKRLGMGPGPRTCLSAACASGLHALIHADLLIKSGVATRALVVAAEASVHPLFIGSFQRLGVLPPQGVGCRPFDHERQGFLMSDAAAAICLDSSETTRGPVRIDRSGVAGDATHLTGSDPAGRALQYLLRRAIDNRPVDLIHAHATGTELHDPVELSAIQACINSPDAPPVVYSHKGALGHSLGASGLVSVVLNCKSHRTGCIPGNAGLCSPLEARGLVLASQPIQRPIRRSVALASGFGGAMAAISLVR